MGFTEEEAAAIISAADEVKASDSQRHQGRDVG
jgi:hypothetical protein